MSRPGHAGCKRSLLEDLAALVLALLFGGFDPALALAAVLAGATVGGAVTGALALAGVHARATDLGGVRGRNGERRARAQQPRRQGGNEGTSALRGRVFHEALHTSILPRANHFGIWSTPTI